MISDDLWMTIRNYMRDYCGYCPPNELRQALEQHTEIYVFDGGAFVARGNEFDLFVVPAKRGRWRIRSEITNYLRKMGKRYGTIVVKVSANNTPSLRLAKFFGFKETSRKDGFIRLESSSWAI